MSESIPTVSGDHEAYKFYIWASLHLRCHECGTQVELTQDLAEDENECPEAIWLERRARMAMETGWYVHPLAEDGSLIAFALCPQCAKKYDLVIQKPNPTTLGT